MSPTTTPPLLATLNDGATTGISSLPTDILESHILTRLDGQTLASATCVSTSLSAGRHNHHLWSNICHSTWPSTANDCLTKFISDFSDDGKNGPRSFFSHTFPLPTPDPTTVPPPPQNQSPSSSPVAASELISAVDIYYRNNPILTKIEETKTTTDWFRCSPFRIDLLDPKDVVPIQSPLPAGGDTAALMDDMTLSWILIDPINKRAVNLSSHKPVSVQRHWLSREVQVRFVSILRGRRRGGGGDAGVVVQCGIVVNCGRSEDGEMQVREVTMEVEDMDGKHLNGRDSLVIFQRAMEAKRGNGVKREEEARRRYRRIANEYM
ncbi:F-box domain, cyclin-like protein [Cynara cardunculus var. scolymus]|uniref:F-box domain, cyclin-like protein n=1 Tax=Cynara cardunculus var. scolymus TaxID=59895 RepID=A0A103XDW4_CYNCS|nr:F-box domain, cyclin-like protein [Cynara cardunculus var. scolymus]